MNDNYTKDQSMTEIQESLDSKRTPRSSIQLGTKDGAPEDQSQMKHSAISKNSINELQNTLYCSFLNMVNDNKRSKSETLLNLPQVVMEKRQCYAKNTNNNSATTDSSTSTLNKLNSEDSKNLLKDPRSSLHTSKSLLVEDTWIKRDNVILRSVSSNFPNENAIAKPTEPTKPLFYCALDNNASDYVLTGYADVHLTYNFANNTISIKFKNLNFKPIIEVNELKSKIFHHINHEMTECTHRTNENDKSNNELKQSEKLVSVKKIKFDKNFKDSVKDVNFKCENRIRKLKRSSSIVNRNGSGSNYFLSHTFVIVFKLHSYLPISRHLLKSTFRKKSRVFRGEMALENINPLKSSFQYIQKEFKLIEL